MGKNCRNWGFDVSALMVLIGETEEFNYRSMNRSLLECLSPCPVVGLQCYTRSFDWQLDYSKLQYYSPFGYKLAPIRNMRLAQAIAKEGLLSDGKITVCEIPESPGTISQHRFRVLLVIWVIMSWVLFLSVLTLLMWMDEVTWIGKTNCVCLCSWSIVLRLLDHFRVNVPVSISNMSKPDDLDAIFILGRRNSCLILRGSRRDIVKWTACGSSFSDSCYQEQELKQALVWLWQMISRVGSILQLMMIFTTIPNGSTKDQLIFVALNVFSQLNVVVGQKLNAKCLFATFRVAERNFAGSRTDVYAFLIRYFARWSDQGDWVTAADLLPSTEVWRRWRKRILNDKTSDPKALYNMIIDEIQCEKGAMLQNNTESEYDTAEEG